MLTFYLSQDCGAGENAEAKKVRGFENIVASWALTHWKRKRLSTKQFNSVHRYIQVEFLFPQQVTKRMELHEVNLCDIFRFVSFSLLASYFVAALFHAFSLFQRKTRNGVFLGFL